MNYLEYQLQVSKSKTQTQLELTDVFPTEY